MNMQIAPGMNVLATCESLSALDVFVEGAPEKLVTRLEEYVRALPQDMTTKKGQDEIRSLAAKISRTKTGLDELGKDHVAALKKQTGAVDAQRKLIRDRLDLLRDEVRDPLTKFEEAEANRINEYERLLVVLAGASVFNGAPSLAEIDDRLTKLEPFVRRDWQEFGDRATEGYDDAVNRLQAYRLAAVKQEADAAELIELRRQSAEHEAQRVAAAFEAAKAENARIAAEVEFKLAAEAAERDRIRIIQQAERDAAEREADELATRQAAEVAENRRLKALEQAARDAEAAAAKAIETERARVAKIEADKAAAAAKLERNKKHRAKIHKEITDFLMVAGLSDVSANAAVEAIAAGKIPHLSITY